MVYVTLREVCFLLSCLKKKGKKKMHTGLHIINDLARVVHFMSLLSKNKIRYIIVVKKFNTNIAKNVTKHMSINCL